MDISSGNLQLLIFIFTFCTFILILDYLVNHRFRKQVEYPEDQNKNDDIESEIHLEIEIMNTLKNKLNAFIFSKASRDVIPEIFETKVMMILDENRYSELSLMNKVYIDAYVRGLSRYRDVS